MEAVTDPWLPERFIQDVGPNAEAAGEGFRLISGMRVDVEIGIKQFPEESDQEDGREGLQNFRFAGHRAVAKEYPCLGNDESDDGGLAQAAKKRDRKKCGGKRQTFFIAAHQVLRQKEG